MVLSWSFERRTMPLGFEVLQAACRVMAEYEGTALTGDTVQEFRDRLVEETGYEWGPDREGYEDPFRNYARVFSSFFLAHKDSNSKIVLLPLGRALAEDQLDARGFLQELAERFSYPHYAFRATMGKEWEVRGLTCYPLKVILKTGAGLLLLGSHDGAFDATDVIAANYVASGGEDPVELAERVLDVRSGTRQPVYGTALTDDAARRQVREVMNFLEAYGALEVVEAPTGFKDIAGSTRTGSPMRLSAGFFGKSDPPDLLLALADFFDGETVPPGPAAPLDELATASGDGVPTTGWQFEFEFEARAPAGETDGPVTRSVPAGRTEVSQTHRRMQQTLYDELVAEHGEASVSAELRAASMNPMDVALLTDDGALRIWEIKTALSARQCIREALGQLLEYGYWPGSLDVEVLVVVGPVPLDDLADQYIATLRERFDLPLEYHYLPVADQSA